MAFHGETRIIYIDSFNRSSGTTSDFNISVDLPRNDFNRVALLQFSCPKSYYNFRQGRNTFTLIENGVETLITIPVGSYGVSSLIANLAPLLTAYSSQGWTYKMSFPKFLEPMTGKLTFTVEGNGGIQPQFKFDTFCFLQLGFQPNTTYTFVGDTLVSENYISLSPINRLFLKSDMCPTADSSILQEILETYPDSSFVYYENTNIENNSKPFISTQSRNFSFTITDRFGIPLDTNGLDIVFSLLLFRRDDTSELHRQEIMLSNFERLLKLEDAHLQMKGLSTYNPLIGADNAIPVSGIHEGFEQPPLNYGDTKEVPRRSIIN